MQSEEFLTALSSSLRNASGDIVAIGMLLIAALFIIIKYYIPERAEEKKFKMKLEQQKLELEAKRQQDTVDVQRENIESRTRQMQVISNLSEQTKALTAQTAKAATELAVAAAKLEDSKANSAKMGQKVDEMSSEVHVIMEQVNDIHSCIYKPEGSE